MADLVKLEIKKIFSKKDIMLILGVLILVPVIFSICIVNKIGGLDFGGQISIADYGLMIWSFLKYLFVLYLVPIYIACSFIGREIENRSINIMLSNELRTKVIASKVITYTMIITAFFILFQLSSILSYLVFVQNSELYMAADTTFVQGIFIYLFQWLEMMFVLAISAFFCSIIKGNAALVLGLGVIIIEKILINIDAIKKVIPSYISDYSSYFQIEPDKLMQSNLFSLGVYMVIIIFFVAVTMNIWRTRDF